MTGRFVCTSGDFLPVASCVCVHLHEHEGVRVPVACGGRPVSFTLPSGSCNLVNAGGLDRNRDLHVLEKQSTHLGASVALWAEGCGCALCQCQALPLETRKAVYLLY